MMIYLLGCWWEGTLPSSGSLLGVHTAGADDGPTMCTPLNKHGETASASPWVDFCTSVCITSWQADLPKRSAVDLRGLLWGRVSTWGGHGMSTPRGRQAVDEHGSSVFPDVGVNVGAQRSGVTSLEGKPVFKEKLAAWDVFICHARADKAAVARPLARALERQGSSVWLDVDQLKIGHRLRAATDVALANCEVAAVILSPAFYQSAWALYEFDGIVARAVSGGLLLVPILHEVTRSEVLKRSPSLANTISRNTADFTIEQIANEILLVVKQWRNARTA